MHSVLIPGGQILSKRQTVFYTSVGPMNKEHKEPNEIDLEAPRPDMVPSESGRNITTRCIGSTSTFLWKKGFKFYQTRSNAIIFYETLPAYCIPKAIMVETGEIIFEKVYASPRLPPKISFEDNWMKELGSCWRWWGLPINPTTIKNPIVKHGETCEKWATIWFAYSKDQKRCRAWLRKRQCKNGETCEELCASVFWTFRSRQRRRRKRRRRSNKYGRLVKSGQSIGLFTQREEIDIDFRVSGLPHAVVKQAENFRVRELVKKIESHLHNPFSDESKAMIREMGSVEFFELCETIPKVQCSECLLYWNQGVI